MELRKRKRVNYQETLRSRLKAAKESTEKSLKTVPSTTVLQPKRRSNIKVAKKKPAKRIESEKSTLSTNGNDGFQYYENRCVVKTKSLERPQFKSLSDNESGVMKNLSKQTDHKEWTEASDFIRKNMESLRKICRFQHELYYKGLKTQQHMGPRNIENVKLPDDMVSYSNILKSMSQFAANIDNIKSELNKKPEVFKKEAVSLNALKNVAKQTCSTSRIEKICALYNIDLKDIRVILSRYDTKYISYQQNMLRSSDIAIIHQVLDKEHSPYTDPSVVWPTKYRRRSPGEPINDGLDKDDPVQKSIPLFNNF